MKNILAFFCAALTCAAAAAQASSAHLTAGPPRLTITAPAERPVVLRSVAIKTEISGKLAATTVEMVFHNPNARVLEGALQFPLLPGQSVLSFAMDVNGQLRDAVPVDKLRGRQVFEDIVRGRIDPGLLQQTQGNNYQLRVYPILPQRDKTVVLRIVESLPAAAPGTRYVLPLDYPEPIDQFSLSVQVRGGAAAPRAAALALQGAGALAFRRTGDRHLLSVARSGFVGRGMLRVDIPAAAGTPIFGRHAGRTYFHADVALPAAAAQQTPRRLPRRIALVWDSSGSGAARDHVRELALLDAYFERAGNASVQLIRVRDVAEPALEFSVQQGRWGALRQALAATDYDGGTDLSALALPAGVEEVLLFSDGLSNFANFGRRGLPAFSVPMYAVSAAARSDPALLRHAAEASGGRFIDLLALSPAQAKGLLLTSTARIESIEASGAVNVVAAARHPVQGRIELAGEMTEAAGSLRIVLALPADAARGERRQTLPVALNAGAGSADSQLAAPTWARLRIAELEGDYDNRRAEIRRIGTAFGLVTRETSLIVLETAADYARYEIAPPPELRAEVERLQQLGGRQRERERKTQLERVVQRFENKLAWWQRDFPRAALPPQHPDAVRGEGAAGPLLRGLAQQAPAESVERRASTAQRERSAANAVAEDAAAVPRAQPEAPAAASASTPTAAPPAATAVDAISGRVAAAAKLKSEADGSAGATASIQLQRWTPDAPYAARLRAAPAEQVYRVYLDERPGYISSTAFFLDTADVLFERGQPQLAQRVLSNLAEMDLENRHVLRILGYRLLQAGSAARAVGVFKQVLALAPDEPQSWRDLGLAQAADGQAQAAIDALYEVVIRPWHGRFPDIELIALAELNAIVATSERALDTTRIDPRLLKNLPLDLRVVLTWDADNTDIDLWVTDPNGERAFYGRQLTYQGGRMSADFTGGYGPEEFSLKRAKPGKYKVQANFFGHRQQIVAGATTLQLRLSTGFGTAQQQDRSVTLRLRGGSETVFVGEFEVK